LGRVETLKVLPVRAGLNVWEPWHSFNKNLEDSIATGCSVEGLVNNEEMREAISHLCFIHATSVLHERTPIESSSIKYRLKSQGTIRSLSIVEGTFMNFAVDARDKGHLANEQTRGYRKICGLRKVQVQGGTHSFHPGSNPCPLRPQIYKLLVNPSQSHPLLPLPPQNLLSSQKVLPKPPSKTNRYLNGRRKGFKSQPRREPR
jgi:hypothetical protein